jgi:hypothetical protein
MIWLLPHPIPPFSKLDLSTQEDKERETTYLGERGKMVGEEPNHINHSILSACRV